MKIFIFGVGRSGTSLLTELVRELIYQSKKVKPLCIYEPFMWGEDIWEIDYLTEKLRLAELLNRITGELSSGQKNRASLAKALINKPKVLFLDEPTASLDPEIGDFVRGFLESYKKENKISILLASHNMSEVSRLCKSVLMMKNGVIIDEGTPEFLIKKHGRKNLEEVFLKLSRSKNEFY